MKNPTKILLFAFISIILILVIYNEMALEIKDDYELSRITKTIEAGTRMSYQKLTHYAAGRHWIFFSYSFIDSGVWNRGKYYTSSLDGVNWEEPVKFRWSYIGADFSIAVEDNDDFHYVYTYGQSGTSPDRIYIWYRKGHFNTDGMITWATGNEQLVSSEHTQSWDPQITLDSNGYPWIVTPEYDWVAQDGETYVYKSSRNDGVWEMDTGFPYVLTDRNLLGGIPLRLSDGKMYFVSGPIANFIQQSGQQNLYGKLWDGNSWGQEEPISDYVTREGHGQWDAISRGDDVYLTYIDDSTKDLMFRHRSPTGWNDAEVLYDTTIYSPSNIFSPSLTLGYKGGEELFCFWIGNPQEFYTYYAHWDGTSWTGPVEWFYDDEIEDEGQYLYLTFQNTPYEVNDGVIGMMYRTEFPPSGDDYFYISYNYITVTEPQVETITCYQCVGTELDQREFEGTECPENWYPEPPICDETEIICYQCDGELLIQQTWSGNVCPDGWQPTKPTCGTAQEIPGFEFIFLLISLIIFIKKRRVKK